MASIKITQTIVNTLTMRKLVLAPQNRAMRNPTLGLSYKEGIDFSKKDYRLLHDDREEGGFWLVETPKGAYPRLSQMQVTKMLLDQYAEWGDLIFGEWESSYSGRVIKITRDIMEVHSKIRLTRNEDRIHFRDFGDGIVPGLVFGTLKAKPRARLRK